MSASAAWIDAEPVDTETLARLSYEIAPALFEMGIADSACASALTIEATEVFQRLHYSFDPIYWDTRDFPDTVASFAQGVLAAIRAEPEWLNSRYVAAQESLSDLLSRHADVVEAGCSSGDRPRGD